MVNKNNYLFEKIRTKYNQLSPSQKKVANYIIKNINNVVFFTISELASRSEVSVATIVRFSYQLGFNSYSELQKEARKIIKAQLSPVKKIEKNMELEIKNTNFSDFVNKSIDIEIQYLNNLKENLSITDLKNTIKIIKNANNIYVTGFRTSYGSAYLLNMLIKQVLNNSYFIISENECIAEEIQSLQSDDLVIIISFPRYTERAIRIQEYAKRLGVKVIVITDSLLSPLGRMADIVIPCDFQGLTYQNTLVPANAIVNLIINLLILSSNREEKKIIKDRIAKIEKQLSEWKVIYFNE